MLADPVALWTSTAFIDDVRTWVAAQLAPRGARLTGEWEQPHARAWSSAIRFETTSREGLGSGRVWFKVNGSGTAYEASLIAVLGELCPGLAPDVTAYDEVRPWSLTWDGGQVLRSKVAPEQLWSYWELLLPRYGQAQLDLAVHRKRLLITGVPDRSPSQLPAQYRRLLDELSAKPAEIGGFTPEQASDVERMLPRYENRYAELAASPVPGSIQHDDLHSNNVCWPGDVEDVSSIRIIDWGDTSVGHPFGTMLSTLNSIAFHAGALHDGGSISDPRVLRMRDAYLEPFTSLATRKELLRWVALARSIGSVARALSWERALQDAPTSVAAQFDFPVRDWMLGMLEPWADVDLQTR